MGRVRSSHWIDVITAPWRRRSEPVRRRGQCWRCWGQCWRCWGQCWSPTQGQQPLHFPPEGCVDKKTHQLNEAYYLPSGLANRILSNSSTNFCSSSRGDHGGGDGVPLFFGSISLVWVGSFWHHRLLLVFAHLGLGCVRPLLTEVRNQLMLYIGHFEISLTKYGFVKIISMYLSPLFNDISIKQCLFLHLWGRRKLYKSNQKISGKIFTHCHCKIWD